MTDPIRLRAVEAGDLPELFTHQLDPVACRMAAFPSRERDAFMAHWEKILAADDVIGRTILVGTEIAGSVACYEQSGTWLIGYWLGRRFWGQGVASRAVAEFVGTVPVRPLQAYVAKHNVASIRVLEKCGFAVSGEGRSAASAGGDVVDELIYTLSA